jgi:hypothetical protein
MRIDVAVLVENTRRIFGRAREGNLGSRRIFLTVLAGHKKKLLAGRYLPTPALSYSNFMSILQIYFYHQGDCRISMFWGILHCDGTDRTTKPLTAWLAYRDFYVTKLYLYS